MRTATKVIYFATASCLLYVVLAAPDRGNKVRKHHKAAVYFEASNPATREEEKEVELDYDLSAERNGAEGVADISVLPTDLPSVWKKVGYLDMADPIQQCPASWSKISSPRASCGKKSTAGACDSLAIGTSGASYQTVCGRFRGYQLGTPDAFDPSSETVKRSIESTYVDGISITYGSPGRRQHIFTYAAGTSETGNSPRSCPCARGAPAPTFVGSDFYCESAYTGSNTNDGITMLSADVLWDGQQCNGDEAACCNQQNLPWFCKTLPAPITGDLEVRLCTDGGTNEENMALEFFELYIK